MWGFNGTARVLIEYQGKSTYKKLLLDPVDVEKGSVRFLFMRRLLMGRFHTIRSQKRPLTISNRQPAPCERWQTLILA